MGLGAAVELRRGRRGLAALPVQGRPLPPADEGTADPADGPVAGTEDLGDLPVGAAPLGVVAVAEQEDMGMEDLLGRGVAVADQLLEPLALLRAEVDLTLLVA